MGRGSSPNPFECICLLRLQFLIHHLWPSAVGLPFLLVWLPDFPSFSQLYIQIVGKRHLYRAQLTGSQCQGMSKPGLLPKLMCSLKNPYWSRVVKPASALALLCFSICESAAKVITVPAHTLQYEASGNILH